MIIYAFFEKIRHCWRDGNRTLTSRLEFGVLPVRPQGLNKAILLLGGRVNGHSLNGWATAPSVGVAPIYTSVISFMQNIAAKRRAAIWRHATHESQGPSGYGSPASSAVGTG